MRYSVSQALLSAILLTVTPAGAVSYTLSSNNSEVTVTDNNGATVWYIDRAINPNDNLFLSNYYFRLDQLGNESNLLSALGAPNVQQNAPNSLTLAFANQTLAATLNWTLVGGAAGSGQSILAKTVSITNLTANSLDLHLFDYSDYDIKFNQLNQSDQATLVAPGHILTTSTTSPTQIDSLTSVTPDHYQITNFITPYLQLFFDTDGPTTLSDQPSSGVPYPTPPGDNAFAFQWDRTLSAGQTFSVGQTASFGPSTVPEPASWAMMITGFGLIGGMLRRRSSRIRVNLA